MGKQDIDLGADVTISPYMKLRKVNVKFIEPYPEREEIIVFPENTLGMLTLFDNGFGSNTSNSRVLGVNDTKVMNKAARIREKYIAQLISDPGNTNPVPDGP